MNATFPAHDAETPTHAAAHAAYLGNVLLLDGRGVSVIDSRDRGLMVADSDGTLSFVDVTAVDFTVEAGECPGCGTVQEAACICPIHEGSCAGCDPCDCSRLGR